MAELRDHLNRTVLHIDIENREADTFLANVKIVFQRNVFINNQIGWKDEIQAEMRWYKLNIDRAEMLDFIESAKTWSALSLSELSQTFFSGCWNLASNAYTKTFEVEFKPLENTPTKTDAFTVRVDINSGEYEGIWTTKEFHSDYTSLVNFINELSASISIEKA